MSLRRPSAAKWRSAARALRVARRVHFRSVPRPSSRPRNRRRRHPGTGWNLGNTLEAQCGETAWGNPAVPRRRLINAVKAAGFNAVRIPAAWDCQQSRRRRPSIAAWMARVKTSRRLRVQPGHVRHPEHPLGWWLARDHPLVRHIQSADNQKQTALLDADRQHVQDLQRTHAVRGHERSACELQRTTTEPTSEHITVQQSYNQTFVNAVRATGGNNATRTLVVQTYNTNAWHGLNYFTMPSDSAPTG